MVFSHVLITRPEPEATELADSLAETGLIPVLMPAFRFEPGFAGVDFGQHWRADTRKLVLFCSRRSVEFGLRQLPSDFLDDVEIAAIGPATASLLEAAGHMVTVLPEGDYNSESLLLHPALNSNPGQALIFAAPGGRQALFDGLKDRNWSVDFAHVYRTVPVDHNPEAAKSLQSADGVISVWTSARAMTQLLDSFESETRDSVLSGAFVVISRRLAALAADKVKDRVYVTDGPGNREIVECILKLI
jgi:uroporphyrinogen-III synthase